MRLTDKKILLLAILGYFVLFGVLTSLRHYSFETQTWDMAAFVQTFWNTSQGRIMQNNTEQVSNHLGLHMSPWLLVLAPGYAVFPTPYYLLVIQTLALALGAWPLYLLARKVLGNKSLSLVVVLSYLLYPSLHWSNFYDFHEITFFVPLFLAGFYFAECRRWGWAGLFFTLAASVKEDAILAVLFAGIYFLLCKTDVIARPKPACPVGGTAAILPPRPSLRGLMAAAILPYFKKNKIRIFGSILIILALTYFILAVKVFMPALGGGVLRFDRYANFGDTPTEAIKTAITSPVLVARTIFTPEKLLYLLILFLPVAFLPFFSWRTLILLLPGLPENLLTNYAFQFSGLYHYDSILIPAIFIGTVFGARNFLARRPHLERHLFWVLAATIAFSFLTRSPINFRNFPVQYFKDTPQKQAYRNLVRLVPPGINVAANTNLVPHLAHREHIYALGLEPFLMDMVLVDLADLFNFRDEKHMQEYIDGYLKSGFYTATLFDDRYLVIAHNKLKIVSR